MNHRKTNDCLLYAICIGIVLMTLGLIIGEARGQSCYIDPVTGQRVCPSSPQVQWQQAPRATSPGLGVTAMDCKVRWSGGWGSGTSAVRLPNGGTGIVTAYHVIQGSDGNVQVINGSGQSQQGKVIATDPQNDLAMIGIQQEWPIVKLADGDELTGYVHARGFAYGQRFMAHDGPITEQGTVAHHGKPPTTCVDFNPGVTFASGCSGGGVFQRQRMVGVLWGSAQGRVTFTPIGPVRQLIRKILGRESVELTPIPPRPTQPQPTPATPRLPDTQLPPEDCGCRQKFSQIDKLHAEMIERLQAVEANAGKVSQLVVEIDKSVDARIDARVEQRVSEIKFPECPKPDTTHLEVRINTLEAQLAELKRTTPVTWDIVPRGEK